MYMDRVKSDNLETNNGELGASKKVYSVLGLGGIKGDSPKDARVLLSVNTSGNAVLKNELYEGYTLVADTDYTCGVSEGIIQDFLDGELDDLMHHRVGRHINSCARCGKISMEFKILKQAASSLGDVSSSESKLGIRSRLREKLSEALGVDIDSPSVKEE